MLYRYGRRGQTRRTWRSTLLNATGLIWYREAISSSFRARIDSPLRVPSHDGEHYEKKRLLGRIPGAKSTLEVCTQII